MSRSARANGTFTEHAVQFTNLVPDTKYFYSLGATDTPLLVRWTNNIAYVTSTNSKIYVNKPGTREQVAVGNKDTFVFSIVKKKLSVTDPEKSFTASTTNAMLVVNTPNNAVRVSITNGSLFVTTTNHVEWVDGVPPARLARKLGQNFTVGPPTSFAPVAIRTRSSSPIRSSARAGPRAAGCWAIRGRASRLNATCATPITNGTEAGPPTSG